MLPIGEHFLVNKGGADMEQDAFSKCHPAVNFIFFVLAIGFSAVIQHPAYLLVSILAALTYYVLLGGVGALKTAAVMLPVPLLIALVNPLFNTRGSWVLFSLFGRPYTMEALLYGAAIGGILYAMLLWFGCYNKVLTADKFTSLFGSLIPAISLLLVMVLRLVPNFMRKIQQLAGARKSVGKGGAENADNREKLRDGITVLGALTSWALEGSIVTGDSMRARGYGCTKRSSFMRYHMGVTDWILLGVFALLTAVLIGCAVGGSTQAEFMPTIRFAQIRGTGGLGLGAYGLFLLLPAILHWKEDVQWHISRSKI